MFKTALLATCAFTAAALTGSSAFAAAASAATSGAGTTIGELVVTAERREENLQDTPIAVSAFSAATLSKRGINGGEDLLLQVPNTNYARTNFGGYNFKIRGVGTDVIGVGGTAGVSINFNELPVSTNNFANEDFYDVDRVEVLRGPQGTLYGRNATGGAVDIITTKPTSDFGGWASAEYGNYSTIKMQGAVNLPMGDAFALRVAGFKLLQNGFGTNLYLNEPVDGRDLGSIRATLSYKPNDKFSAYLIYQNNTEDDTRNRVGKQLCIKDQGPSYIVDANGAHVPVPTAGGPIGSNYAAFLNQGCVPGSLYQNAAYGTLNSNGTLAGVLANFIGLGQGVDLFGANPLQNHNLHDIESAIQPLFKVNEALVDFHVAWNITDNLTLTNIFGFNSTTGISAEDYNRIVPRIPYQPVDTGPYGPLAQIYFPNGVVRDPQTGTSNLLTSFDYGTAQDKEYTDELRLTSSFKGKFNFAVGIFYAEQTEKYGTTNYFVESNALTAASIINNVTDGSISGAPIYIDPGYPPDGTGHNYYDARFGGLSLKTYAGFGEMYIDLLSNLKLTVGGRYNVDQLYNVQYPISLLSGTPNNAAQNFYVDPVTGYGTTANAPGAVPAVGDFPQSVCATSLSACLIAQSVTYRAFTGRVNLDWTPHVSFTDKTLVYASYSRGYKGGGFNTPCQASLGQSGSSTAACGYSLSYQPEYINAFELGSKNTLAGGKVTFNFDGFYYDYVGYQISRIVSESSVNENINANIYGIEMEGVWNPVPPLTLNANFGWLHSSIADGENSIDSLNLTQGNPNYTLVKELSGANCLAPTAAVAGYIEGGYPAYGLSTQCFDVGTPGHPSIRDGVPVNLSGHSLPNTPQFTISVGAQYVFTLPADWTATLRGDFYWQDSSYARVYNAVNDVLQSYEVFNATLTFASTTEGLQAQFFIKNAFNAQPITGTYVTDPTSGLFTNVFTLDPRTYGVQLTKRF